MMAAFLLAMYLFLALNYYPLVVHHLFYHQVSIISFLIGCGSQACFDS